MKRKRSGTDDNGFQHPTWAKAARTDGPPPRVDCLAVLGPDVRGLLWPLLPLEALGRVARTCRGLRRDMAAYNNPPDAWKYRACGASPEARVTRRVLHEVLRASGLFHRVEHLRTHVELRAYSGPRGPAWWPPGTRPPLMQTRGTVRLRLIGQTREQGIIEYHITWSPGPGAPWLLPPIVMEAPDGVTLTSFLAAAVARAAVRHAATAQRQHLAKGERTGTLTPAEQRYVNTKRRREQLVGLAAATARRLDGVASYQPRSVVPQLLCQAKWLVGYLTDIVAADAVLEDFEHVTHDDT